MSGGSNGPYFILCGETGLRAVKRLHKQHQAMQYEDKKEISKFLTPRLLAT